MTLFRALLWLCAALLPGGLLLVPLLLLNSASRSRQRSEGAGAAQSATGAEAPNPAGAQT